MYYEPRGKESNNITYTHIDTLEAVIDNWKYKIGYTEEEIDLNLIRIGGLAQGGGLFVGIGPNEDSIFLHIWDSGEGGSYNTFPPKKFAMLRSDMQKAIDDYNVSGDVST